LRAAPEPKPKELLGHLSPCNLVLVEGFKRAAYPKLEVWRSALGRPLLQPEDPLILAVASDVPLPGVRHYHLDDLKAIVHFILEASQDHA